MNLRKAWCIDMVLILMYEVLFYCIANRFLSFIYLLWKQTAMGSFISSVVSWLKRHLIWSYISSAWKIFHQSFLSWNSFQVCFGYKSSAAKEKHGVHNDDFQSFNHDIGSWTLLYVTNVHIDKMRRVYHHR